MARYARLPKRLIFIILSFVLTTPAGAQQQYLVAPDAEIVPLGPGADASSVIRDRRRNAQAAVGGYCGPYGYPGDPWPAAGWFNAYHRDVMGQWYVSPVQGTIDTIFWWTGAIGDWLMDSTVYLRVHRSNVGFDYGPGARPGPFDPPCRPWGYWMNTNDPDMGVAAFPELATDTQWIPTYPSGYGIPSTPPIGENLWGTSAGFAVKLRPDGLNFAVMDILGTLNVVPGEKIFISIELSAVSPIHPHFDEIPTQFYTEFQTVSTADEYYPSRNWKFYEHDKGPSDCSGMAIDTLKRGWYARGTPAGDSLEVARWDIWFTMTVDAGAPPIVEGYTSLGNTFDTGARLLQAAITDCYAHSPPGAGVASAFIVYEVDGTSQAPVPMSYIGADVWEGMIPGQLPGAKVTARVEATDLEANTGTGSSISYTVVPFGTAWYAFDTGYACVPADISASGTAVDPASFFLPPDAPPGASPGNDGTSGPYDMGGRFTIFGDWYRYAWIGVDGVIALSKTDTDTQDVNANIESGMFIAPFRADHVVERNSATYGSIRHGDGGDTCRFIVEWDSIGNNTSGLPAPDATTFRVVLNRCDGTVEFQYGDPGERDYVPGWKSPITPVLAGLRADSGTLSGPDPGYVLLNRDGFPVETRPEAGRCIRLYPTAGFVSDGGWTLASIPSAPLDGDHSVGALFPGLTSKLWGFNGGFTPLDTVRPGMGFWVKTEDAGRIGHAASLFTSCVEVPVRNGWNLIGGPSCIGPTGSVIATGGTVSSSFSGYGSSGYYIASTLVPGRAYWVKMNGAGTLRLCCP